MIYESDEEFSALPSPLEWRHVRYEPPDVDFTWEREWRIKCEELTINPQVASVVVANAACEARLVTTLQDEVSEVDELLLHHYVENEGLHPLDAEYCATSTRIIPCEWRIVSLQR